MAEPLKFLTICAFCWAGLTQSLAQVTFSAERGFFDQPFTLVLSAGTPGTTIRYTTDGSLPTTNSGTIYTGALTIGHTTTLRAAAFDPSLQPASVQTHTYIFLDDVLVQPSKPPGFPITTTWSDYGWPSQYGMNPDIVNGPRYRASIKDDLLSLPSLSIVMRTDDMFGPTNGIYSNPHDTTLEAPCSLELINPDGAPGFQCDAGIKLHGGGSRLRTMKHPLRLLFQAQYGPTKLKYRLFPDSPVTEFDKFDLRADYNNHWAHGFDPVQRARGGLVRDSFFKDVQAAMGDLSSHSRYAHLYINGLYWGVYNPCERPDASFAASYLGGAKADYDAIDGTGAELVDGDLTARNALLALNNSGLASLDQYEQIKQYLDVPQYIDYLVLQLYGADWDWGQEKNWYAVRRRAPGAGFEYLCWDSERTLEGLNDWVTASPDNLEPNLALNSEYRLLFADRLQKHFFNDGALTTNAVLAAWRARAAQIERAMVAESARWGTSVPNGKTSLSPPPYPGYSANTPYTRDENWLGEQGRLITNYFPFRSGVVLTQFMRAGLYPSVVAPEFNQHGGHVAEGFGLTMAPATAPIYYTTDATDPRVYGLGAPSASARLYAGAIPLWSNVVVKARALSGGVWSALDEAEFRVQALGPTIALTELMYYPVGGDAFQFIELENLGTLPVDLSGYSLQGISYVFPYATILAPQALLLLGSNDDPAAFAARYPGVVVAGTFGGSLSNTGQRVAVLDAKGSLVTAVNYMNTGDWPTAADGGGHSLEIIDPNGDPQDPANWRASLATNGSPGALNAILPLPEVRLNEAMAYNISAVTNQGAFPDWVELCNASAHDASLADWTLNRSGKKFVFPPDASIPAHGYLIVWCDHQTNAPGLHTGFNLGRKGESLFLYDAATNRVDALSFGPQAKDYTVGRIGPEAAWQLTLPTPGSENIPAPSGGATNLVLNEWLAKPAPGDSDWIELFNTSSNMPVGLAGLYLAASNSLFQLRALSFVDPRGFVQLFADKEPGPDHLDFKLSAAGDAIRLYDSAGQVLDAVGFRDQVEGISEGRFPDGSANIVTFPGSVSPGAPNYIMSPKIESVETGDGAVTLHFSLLATLSYSLQFREDLSSGTWQSLADFDAVYTNATISFKDALKTGRSRRFYRLVTPKSR